MIRFLLRYTFILATLVFASSLWANDLPKFTDEIKKYVSNEAELENIVYTNYELENTFRTVFERNDNEQISIVFFQSLTGNDTWTNVSKTEYFYDDRGNQSEVVESNWENGAWVLSQETSYVFDDNGNIEEQATINYLSNTGEKQTKEFNGNLCTKSTIYTWSNSNWVLSSEKTTTSYNFFEFPTQETFRTNNSGILTNSTQIDYEYEGRDPRIELYKNWTGSSWENAFRITNTYSNGKIESKLFEYFNNNAWVEESKYEYTYSGNELSIVRKLEKDAGVWKEKSNINLTYSGNDVELQENVDSSSESWKYEMSSSNYSSYQMQNTDWIGISKYANTTSDGSFIGEFTTYTWSDDAKAWNIAASSSETWTNSSDANSQKLIFTQKGLDERGLLELKKEIVFNFTSGISTVKNSPKASAFSVYPNPVKDVFTIQQNFELSNAMYYIYNTSGRLLSKGILNSPSQVVNIAGFSQGQYIVTVVAEKQSSSLIILKQ